MTEDLRDRLTLALVPGLGPRLTAALIRQFGSAAGVRRASAEHLRQVPHIGPKLSADFRLALNTANVDRELQLLEKHGVRLIDLDSTEYPAALKQISDPPHLLFVRGQIAPGDEKAIAIVGSREHTTYGRRTTERIAQGLARAGYTVVSGLARGIDGFAHRATLEAGGRTIAVLAGGLSRIYPPEHTELADRVAASGALITETPMQVAPQAGMFPARNRLISGVSRGVIVVEAHERSGALITARHALDQGRDVFTIPGPVDSAASAGCLKLLRDGAKLVRSAEDVLEDLGGEISVTKAKAIAPSPPPELEGDAQRVWLALSEGTRFVDDLARELALPIPELTRLLMQLELKRIVRRLPGNQYERR